ncbi:MAG: OmpA/MotB family protein [Rickettsiales bacterium]
MTKKQKFLESSSHYIEDQWISLSDLMTGLMMIFMLIAVSYMLKVESDQSKIREIAILYNDLRIKLYEDLNKEFEKDLNKWGAEFDTKLTLRFKEPEVLFETGKDELNPKFKEILNNFFPRYLKIITSEKYKSSIQEIRIEGHTSSIWNDTSTPQEAYFFNMALSQARTRSALQFILGLNEVKQDSQWIKQHVTANGLSSSKPIIESDGSENKKKSQRVEFRIITDSEAKMAKITESIE